MTRDYFSRKGGPYFIGQTFSKHPESFDNKGLNSITLIGKIRSLFKFPRFGRKK
jgi:hypothetical protein